MIFLRLFGRGRYNAPNKAERKQRKARVCIEPCHPHRLVDTSMIFGIIILPTALPVTAIPVASGRFWSKYSPTITIDVVNINPNPIPLRIPNPKKRLQKFGSAGDVAHETRKPKPARIDPPIDKTRKPNGRIITETSGPSKQNAL